MNYRLAVITHVDAPTLSESLASFDEFVTPTPAETVIVIDGPSSDGLQRLERENGRFNIVHTVEPQGGFCFATRTLWEVASRPGADWVLWLEADFLLTRPVDLRQLATILTERQELAQMSLMRQPVNWIEKSAGSLVNAHPEWYEMHFQHRAPRRYMIQRAYFTTNVNLMPRQFMVDHPWPEHARECEGKFGIELVEKGYAFGVWGHGEVFTEHIGIRSGFGY